MNLLEKVDLALCLLSESGISYCYLFFCTEDTLQSVDCTSSDVVSYVCIGFHHGRKTLHQLIRHNIRVHMQPSDALCLLFDCYSVHSSVISTRMPIFFWVHFLTSVMCSIYFPTLHHQCVSYTHQSAFFVLNYVDFSLYKYHCLTLYNMLFCH